MRVRRRGREEGPVWGMMGSLSAVSLDAPPPPPLRDQLAVFSRPRTSEDDLPPEVIEELRSSEWAHAVDEPDEDAETKPRRAARLPLVGRIFRREVDPEWRASLETLRRKTVEELGSHLADESRLLLQDVGIRHKRLYAIPTTTGQVSVYLIGGRPPKWGGTTTAELPSRIKWLVSYGREPNKPMRLTLFGLVAVDVVAVEIELRSETRRAVLGNNGVFYEAEGQEPHELLGLVLHEKEGGRRHVALRP